MPLNFTGAAIDVLVGDLGSAERFYTVIMGRAHDLEPGPHQREWRLCRQPEVVLRLTALPESAGYGKVAIGVHDLAEERARLALEWPDVPEIWAKPKVIALLELADPDGNEVTLWQDLMGANR